MKRLTNKNGIPLDCVKCVENTNCFSNMGCKKICESLGKLKEHEDLEEQGMLLKLPCKVGDKVFIPIDFQRKIYQGVVTGIEYSKIRKGFVAKIRTIDEGVCYEKLEDFGNTVFLTHEEADINLSEMIRKESENK